MALNMNPLPRMALNKVVNKGDRISKEQSYY